MFQAILQKVSKKTLLLINLNADDLTILLILKKILRHLLFNQLTCRDSRLEKNLLTYFISYLQTAVLFVQIYD